MAKPYQSCWRRNIGGILAVLCAFCHISVSGQESDDFTLDVGVQLKTHFRHSVDNQFPFRFPRPTSPPPPLTLETVDGGDHFEISSFTLFSDATYKEWLTGRIKVDMIDIYDRNSTSDDKDVDVDEYWLRFGQEVTKGRLPTDDGRHAYLKIGKFGKFERQDDRHLESYGLIATAFNRFEDQGLELGLDITPNLYIKASITSGNPVFMRDPNALAGDNGTTKGIRQPPDPDLESGWPIFYDAEVEDWEWNQEFAESGLGAGLRLGNEAGTRTLDLLLYGYERDLRDSAKLHGTHYGGDLDLFALTQNEFPTLPGDIVLNDLRGDYKREYGATLWVYFDNTTLFSQFVQQDIAGLDRKGWEIELSQKFDLPSMLTLRNYQLLSSLAPVIRYSCLNPNFSGARLLPPAAPPGPGSYPAPSAFWEWEKIDIGLRVGVAPGVFLTTEYALHNIKGRAPTNTWKRNNDEFLTTLSWKYIF